MDRETDRETDRQNVSMERRRGGEERQRVAKEVTDIGRLERSRRERWRSEEEREDEEERDMEEEERTSKEGVMKENAKSRLIGRSGGPSPSLHSSCLSSTRPFFSSSSSSSSPPFLTSSPFPLLSLDGEEVSVAIVTLEEEESCPSEPFGPAHTGEEEATDRTAGGERGEVAGGTTEERGGGEEGRIEDRREGEEGGIKDGRRGKEGGIEDSRGGEEGGIEDGRRGDKDRRGGEEGGIEDGRRGDKDRRGGEEAGIEDVREGAEGRMERMEEEHMSTMTSSPQLQSKMKRKLDHGPDGRPFPSGKKQCKDKNYLSPSSLVPFQTTPTTFGDLRLANGHSAQRRRVTSGPPPTGLQDWLRTFQAWSGPERLLALDELIDRCETNQVKHMLQVIEPQFQRDFISLLPKELALYVLTFLAPRDLLQSSQTCRYWRILAEDNLLWREKCREEGIPECVLSRRRRSINNSPWKSAFIRQHRIERNWRTGDTRTPKVLKGHDDHVITCLQFSSDLIVSGSDDNTLKVWSADTGKCLRTLTGHTGGVWCSQMAGATVISGSTDRTLRVWDAESGECVHTLYGHTSTVRCMHLHGNRVVSGSRDSTLRVWDTGTGECVGVLTGHVAAVRCVQYDGRRVVSGGYDYVVKVWDPDTERCLHTLQGHTNRVYSLQFDGVHVVSGSLDTSIRVWDAETGGCVHTLTGHQSLTSGMELRDNILVSGNADSTVRVWNITTGECLHTLQGPNKHQSAVTCLQFCRGLVLSSSDDGTVKLWDLKTGAWLRDVVALQSRGSGGVVWRIRASDTRLVCAAGSRNGTEETKLLVLDFDLDEDDSKTAPE